MLFFGSSFQTCVQAWEVLLREYLQSCLLTLFLYLCFRRSLCFGGMLRRLFPCANRFFPLPRSLLWILRPTTARSCQLECSGFPSSTLEALLSRHIRCQSR